MMSYAETMNSIWLEHAKYPGYRFSPEGNVLSLVCYKRPVMSLKQTRNKDGYLVVTLNRKSAFVHRAIAEIFLEKPINSDDHKIIQVNHINGVKHDNRVENLEWVTPKQNQNHSRKILGNRCALGSLSGSAKLTDENVLKIKERLLSIKRGEAGKLAKEFGISQATISMIKRGKVWGHLNPQVG